jgi:hypothetical protein
MPMWRQAVAPAVLILIGLGSVTAGVVGNQDGLVKAGIGIGTILIVAVAVIVALAKRRDSPRTS